MSNDEVLHPDPAWRDRANFIIAARIERDDASTGPATEQLWVRQLDDYQFEICCIPFFIYDLALGDEVSTGTAGDDRYIVESLKRRSGRFVFRVWFSEATDREELRGVLIDKGCLLETRGPASRLLAVDVANEDLAKEVAELLQEREARGEISYETGRLT